jgi:SAM-dependent methyltransferase
MEEAEPASKHSKPDTMVVMPEMSGLARAFCSSPPYGALARWVLLPCNPELRMVATDYDPEMVATLERRVAPFGKRGIVQRVDATNLPFADGRFDIVISVAMLHHVLDWERAVGEAVRVLRHGGHLVGYDLLHAASSRHSHHEGSGSTRMMGPGQLEAELGRLPVAGVRTRRSLGGFALRFLATRA